MRNSEEKSSWIKKVGMVILIIGAIAWTVVSCTAEAEASMVAKPHQPGGMID